MAAPAFHITPVPYSTPRAVSVTLKTLLSQLTEVRNVMKPFTPAQEITGKEAGKAGEGLVLPGFCLFCYINEHITVLTVEHCKHL